MSDRYVLLSDLQEAIENQLLNSKLDIHILDRLDTSKSIPKKARDRSIVVMPISSVDTNDYGRGDLARMQDNFQVDLMVKIESRQQKKNVREGWVLEEQIRIELTRTLFFRDVRMTYTGTPTRSLTADGSWYIISQTYTTRRDAPLGGR